MAGKRVLSIGQCAADHAAISATLRKSLGAEVVAVDGLTEARSELQKQPFALILVNRILDADGGPGLEVIKQLRNDPLSQQVPVMIVSNYDDAQQKAVAAGAQPGFGKASLGQPEMLARVKPFLP